MKRGDGEASDSNSFSLHIRFTLARSVYNSQLLFRCRFDRALRIYRNQQRLMKRSTERTK